jgi:hypothetical protein
MVLSLRIVLKQAIFLRSKSPADIGKHKLKFSFSCTLTQQSTQKSTAVVRHQWLTPVILATWEAEIRRIKFQGQPRQIVHKSPSTK